MEAHEGVGQHGVDLALDVFVIDVLRDRVVDVQKRHGVAGHAGADILRQCAVDIHFAGNRDAAGGKTAVDIAGFKTELRRECRPALVCKSDILACALVLFSPVQKGQFKLCHAREQVRIVAAFAHFFSHVLAHISDAGIILMLAIADQQVQFAVLFDLNAELIESLDGSVAGEEVLRTRSEGDDLQVGNTQHGPCDRDELRNAVGQIIGGAHGFFRDIALEMAHVQVVGAIQHAAVSIAASVDHVSVAFSSSNEHHGAVKILGDQGFGRFRAEVAEENNSSVAFIGFQLFNSFQHILFIFDRLLDFHDRQFLFSALFGDGTTAAFAQRDRKTVTGNRDKTQFHNRNIAHGKKPPNG